jgi:hypothetical protein
MDQRLKCKSDTLKFLKENTASSLGDRGIGNAFLDTIAASPEVKARTD